MLDLPSSNLIFIIKFLYKCEVTPVLSFCNAYKADFTRFINTDFDFYEAVDFPLRISFWAFACMPGYSRIQVAWLPFVHL